jgi:hypothetical protein
MRWIIRFLVVVLCLCMAAPVLAADQGETVWSKYNMKLYGRVKMDYIYQNGRSSASTVATNIVDKLTTPDYKNDSTNFKARDTRFGFISSHEAGDWVGKGRFEIDFYGTQAGNSNTPRFRLGYVDLANKDWGTSFRAGKDWQAISQLHPSTIDFGILLRAGNLWERPDQFTVRQKVGDNLEVLVTAFKFVLGSAANTGTGDESVMPWVGTRVAYSFEAFDGKHLLAVNAAYQGDEDNDTKEDVDRWMVGGEFKFSLGPVLLKGEAWYGEAIAGHFSRSDAIAVQKAGAAKGDTTQEVEAWGGWIDATYKIMPKWSITAGVGIDDPEEDDFEVSGTRNSMGNSAFSENLQTYVNTWYSITPAIKVGAEWMYVDTERKEGDGDPNPGNNYSKSYSQILGSVFYNF